MEGPGGSLPWPAGAASVATLRTLRGLPLRLSSLPAFLNDVIVIMFAGGGFEQGVASIGLGPLPKSILYDSSVVTGGA